MIVTFQDMTDQLPNPDGNVQVGVFIINSGGNLAYIPVISQSQSVLPLDSIFLPDKNQFFPLTDKVVKWISSVTPGSNSGKPKVLADGIQRNPTVEMLVNPPRTGKFVYASTSRFQEFLASLPNNIKQGVLQTFTTSPLKDTLYDSMKDFDGVVTMLKSNTPDQFPRYLTHEELWPHSLNMVTWQDDYIPSALANQVLQDGYGFIGDREQVRYAVEESFPGGFNQLGNVDVRGVYPIVFKNGTIMDCFVPRKDKTGNYMNFVLLPNGDFAYGNSFVTRGSQSPVVYGFGDFIADAPTCSLRELEGFGQPFALFDFDGDMLGVFILSSTVSISNVGYSLAAVDYFTGVSTRIQGLYNRSSFVERPPAGLLVVPAHSIVVLLGKDVTETVEVSPNAADQTLRFGMNDVLGDRMSIKFDGSEYWVDGMPMADEVELARRLVMQEHVSPTEARGFIKKAKEKGEVTILMSKKADFTGSFPANQIPNWGKERNKDENRPSRTQGKSYTGAKNAYDKTKYDSDNRIIPPLMIMDPIWMRGLQTSILEAAQTGDETTLENSILAEILKLTPRDVVLEYLPDLATGIDRLGRTLFVFRLNLRQLTTNRPVSQINGLINHLRTSYRGLGDNYLDLLSYSATSELDADSAE